MLVRLKMVLKTLTMSDKPQHAAPVFSFFIIALGIISAIGPLSIDMYLPAFGDISRSLGTSIASVQLCLTSYLIGLALGQLIYGPLSDHFGRKIPLQTGLVIYVIASIFCALATDIKFLILFRIMQAFGVSASAVIIQAMVRDRYNPNHTAQIFSLLILIVGVCPILAPIAGGYITNNFGWCAIFNVLVVSGAFCLLLSIYLPETCPEDKRAPQINFKSIFKVYFKIVSDRHYLGYALCNAIMIAGVFCYVVGSPFVIIELYHIPKEHFGWVFGSKCDWNDYRSAGE